MNSLGNGAKLLIVILVCSSMAAVFWVRKDASLERIKEIETAMSDAIAEAADVSIYIYAKNSVNFGGHAFEPPTGHNLEIKLSTKDIQSIIVPLRQTHEIRNIRHGAVFYPEIQIRLRGKANEDIFVSSEGMYMYRDYGLRRGPDEWVHSINRIIKRSRTERDMAGDSSKVIK